MKGRTATTSTAYAEIMPSLDYDYIIAGGGCAGLSMAYHLHKSTLKDARVLILDTSPKVNNDKTWCYWSTASLPYACTQKTYWDQLEFISPRVKAVESIAPMRYTFVNSLDFYEEIQAELAQNPNIHFKYERVLDIEDTAEGSKVFTNKGIYTASWTFNSVIFPQKRHPDQHVYQLQHFGGWYVKASKATFNPEKMRLMDFQPDQEGDVRFVYVLPFSEKEALVEFTIFSGEKWSERQYDDAIKTYLAEHWDLDEVEITHREYGGIPMTDHSFQRHPGLHVVNLGTAGGQTKPTTGYTFLNIQRDVQQIVKALEETGKPFYTPTPSGRFTFYDKLLLYIIQNEGGRVRGIFERLFSRNRFTTILRFLDERTKWWQELPILLRLPWMPFLRAIWYFFIKKQPIRQRGQQPTRASIFSPKSLES